MTMSSKYLAKPQLRVVFDTNVYIAAILRPGLSEELVSRGLKGHFIVIISEDIVAEIRRKLTEKLSYPPIEADRFIDTIRSHAVVIKSPGKSVTIIDRDPDDNRILACAHSGKAHLIITLDKDLLDLQQWEGISILHPKTFRWILAD